MIPLNKIWNASALLFSGRENPVWTLNTEQQKKWMLLWKEAPLSDRVAELPSKLGYTGCKLQFNKYSHWQLYNGCVSFFDHETVFSKKDEGGQMERFLLSTAPEEVREMLREQEIIQSR